MDSSLIYGIATMGAGVVALLIRYSFKSKCSDISLCFGLVRIQRNVEEETEEMKMEMKTPKRDGSVRNLAMV